MRIPDIELTSVQFQNDPLATRDLAILIAKLSDILRDVYMNLQTTKIVTVAPSVTELQEILTQSDIVILHNATAANRKIWYKYQGSIYAIASA